MKENKQTTARPYVSKNELVVLSSSLFLFDIRENHVPDIRQIDVKMFQRIQYRYRLRKDFRKGFRSEYLGALFHQAKSKV